jgi:hypothetical protein
MIILFQLIHAALFWIQDFIPTAEFFVYPYLASRGLAPYSQIVDHHFPGLFLLPLNFYRLGFVTPQSFKLLTLLVILFSSWMLYLLGRKMYANSQVAKSAVILYTIWQLFFSGSLLWIDILLPLFLLPGLYLFKSEKYLYSGIFFAMAIMFKQTAILPLLFLSAYLLAKVPKFISFIFPSLASLLVTLSWFYFSGSLSDFLFWNFTFNIFSYSSEAARGVSPNELVKLSLPIVIFLYVSYAAFKSKSKSLLQLVGLVVILSMPAFSRFGMEHFQPAVPFFCLLASLALDYKKSSKYIIYVISLIWVAFFMIRANPAGRMINFSVEDERIYTAAKNLHKSGYSIALLGSSPIIYPVSDALPPGDLFFFPLPWFFSKLEARQLETWQEKQPDYIIFNPRSIVDGKDIFTSAPRLVEYMQMNYRKDLVISGNEFYKKI